MSITENDSLVISHRNINDNYHLLELEWKEAERVFKPGNFIQIEVSKSTSPFLRRPFSIFDVKEDSLKVLYRRIGAGTRALSMVKENDRLNLIGPLGNSLIDFKTEGDILIVGGGTGFASLHFLAKFFDRAGISYKAIFGFIGERDVLYENSLKGEIIVCTEDGTVGVKGVVTDCIDYDVIGTIFACGPEAMLKEVERYKSKVKYFSFERYMGCGLGLCNACIILMKDGHFHKSCQIGPNISSKDIAWT